MTQDMVVRAWKDPAYRASLPAYEQAALAANPAGLVELSDTELMEVNGGTSIACVIIATVVSLVAAVCPGDGPTAPSGDADFSDVESGSSSTASTR